VTFTINGQTAPNVAPIVVREGQVVHLRIINDTTVVHPMHLHGHTFAVLKRNGHALTGSPVLLDTLNLFPGESYDVAFIANNPGVWMLHCHNLVHARQGMSMMVMYQGVVTPFKNGGPAGNISD
jgi:FtsP/CotA-like multicopper oxidase with cupredoxin domain